MRFMFAPALSTFIKQMNEFHPLESMNRTVGGFLRQIKISRQDYPDLEHTHDWIHTKKNQPGNLAGGALT
jgi:hypothetical protein